MTTKSGVHEYHAEAITVLYEPRRCTHAFECVRALPGVFSTNRRRWVEPTKATPDEIAAAVERCPTGALRFVRKDGGAEERIPDRNQVRVAADGALYLSGNLEIHSSAGVARATRLALCRCGASRNKPFCDNSHERIGFYDTGTAKAVSSDSQTNSGVLRVVIDTDGPCALEGAFTLVDTDGSTVESCTQRLKFCRCGRSQQRPLCDGSHAQP